MLGVVLLSIIMLGIILLSFILLSIIMLGVVLLSVIMLNVVTLSVVAPVPKVQIELYAIAVSRTFYRLGFKIDTYMNF